MTTKAKLTLIISMLVCSLNVFALQTGYYASKSALSKGHWAKVKVTQTGICEITYDQLRAAGFSNPEKVTVHGYGGVNLYREDFSSSYKDDVKQIYCIHQNDKILFYGEADTRFRLTSETQSRIERNFESTAGYYFITDGVSYEGANTIAYKSLSIYTDKTSHIAMKGIQPFTYNLSNGGAYFFSDNAVGRTSGRTVEIDVSDRATGAYVICSLQCIVQSPKTYKTLFLINNNQYGVNKSGASSHYFDKKNLSNITINDESLTSFSNKLKMNYKTVTSETTYCGFNYLTIVYNRNNSLGDLAQLPLAYSSAADTGLRFLISDATEENCRVWLVKDPSGVRPFELRTLDSGEIAFTLDKSYSGNTETSSVYMIAFNPQKQQYATEIVGDVENQDIHGMATPEMLILTNDLCEEQANRLAQLHKQYQGMDVIVLNHKQVFNEFSSGTPSVMAYRRVAKMFYDRNSSKFKHLLIFGGGTLDNRHAMPELLHMNYDNTMLTYQCRDIDKQISAETNFTNDNYFGVLTDQYGYDSSGNAKTTETIYTANYYPQVVNVGRIPAMDISEAKNYVDKVERVLSGVTPLGAFTKYIFASDDGDADSHAKAAEEITATFNELQPNVTTIKVYNGFYVWNNNDATAARNRIISSYNSGAGLFFYTGHGRSDSFTAENLWSRTYIQSTKYDYPPFAYLATCTAFAFDCQDNNIVENMLLCEGGGNMAVVAACREVYQSDNQTLALAFFNRLASATRKTTIGELFRNARNDVLSTSNTASTLFVNTHCYNLAGDPALYVDRPNYGIKVNTVNGKVFDGTLAIDPLTEVVIKGSIVDNSENVITTFNGTVNVSLYDGATTAKNLYQDNNNYKLLTEITQDETEIAKFAAEVANGEFEIRIIAPAPSNPGVKNRLVIGACSNDNQDIALGGIPTAIINNYSQDIEHVADTEGPQITDMYINTPEFANGDLIQNTAVFHATISDASGINFSNNALSIRLVIDNSKNFTNAAESLTCSKDGSMTIELQLSDITDGSHTIKLQVADVIGNVSEKELSFNFINIANASLTVEEDPATTEATLNYVHSLSGDIESNITIESLDGKTVFTASNVTFPYVWNLKDNSGNDVPAGHYKAFVKSESLLNNHTGASVEIIVVRL